jgi:hypothetical protein
MKWNPFLNAAAAVLYIGAVALFMRYIESIRADTPDTFIDGIGFLSLFVTSAAVMAFLFFYRPAALLIEHKQAEAVAYFLKTLAIFGTVTVVALTLASLQ